MKIYCCICNIINLMKKVELLAPAKDKQTAITAINSGCDAIYIGAQNFVARKKVGNSLEDIKEIFKVAYNYYELPAVYCGKTESEIVEINGASRKASAEFTTYDEMLNSLKKYMSIEVIAGKSPWSATAKEYYLEKDGNLYVAYTWKGTNISKSKISNTNYVITLIEKNKIDGMVTINWLDVADEASETENIDVELIKENGNWKINKYDLK